MGVITDATDVAAALEGRPVRHPCQVTFDRLAEHSEKYADQLTPRERAAIEVVMRALMAVGNGSR